ncbi:MAG TPA: deoxyribodipyrimidine photo-lyase [Candidatus Rubrimentiphilum sp.]|nr:deoxyribodipyrimidine photo-lyase [Candidatus Rubrimentiphilum sp.]
MPVAVYRFTRDLRLDDHAGLSAASAHGDIAPALILDRQLEDRLRSSPRRAAHFCGAAAALDAALRERGSALIVRRGEASVELARLMQELDAPAVAWSASYDRAGIAAGTDLQAALEERGARAIVVHDSPAIPPEESTAARSSAGAGYKAFVPYYDVWRELEPGSYEAPLLLSFMPAGVPSEPLPQPSDFGSDAPVPDAGAPRAREKLERFLRGQALQYSFAINVPADDRTSHLSADLTLGTLAARTVLRETRNRMEDPFLLSEERASLRLFARALAMRDFFLQLSWYNPQTSEVALQEKMREFPFLQSHPQLEAWREGRTGFPLVDAGMRQLRATGWMHPRVRAIAASFLCFDLGIDWRVGMAEWDRYLIEDDPALGVGNWQWIAGVGADLAAYPRVYNPYKQARRFDPDGAYARRWIAELAHGPAPGLSETQPGSAQIELPLGGAERYPRPVLDHDRAARDFLARYQEFVTPAGGRRSSRR